MGKRVAGRVWWGGVLGAWLGLVGLGFGMRVEGAGGEGNGAFQVHLGACDASAAAALGKGYFVAANDEENVLRVYARASGGAPVFRHDFSGGLGIRPGGKEADLEGAAVVGDRVYWIGSHGLDAKDRRAPDRERFAAVQIHTEGGGFRVTGVGRVYRSLLEDLAAHPKLRELGLAPVPGRKDTPVNIEGLCAGEGGGLWLGFREPLRGGKAMIVPLLNPDAMLNGTRASLGDPIFLDLDGMGIRDLAREGARCWILAAKPGGGGKRRLFSWGGVGQSPVEQTKLPKGVNAEAIVVYPGEPGLQILTDDSSERSGAPCGEEVRADQRRFRSFWIEP